MKNEIAKLEDITLLDIGNTIKISGAVWSGDGYDYICYFPDEFDKTLNNKIKPLIMDLEDWKKFIRQTDIMETEILMKDEGKLIKGIIRKTARQIDQRISWKVFKRDGYKCRYCHNNDVPLTVDHIVLWEEGGASVEDNLITSCKKCNKTRGSMPYEEWIQSDYYKKKIAGDIKAITLNQEALSRAIKVPKVIRRKSR